MAEHRDPGTGGEPDQPEHEQPHDDAEPEFGSSEWLLAQLTGGRRAEPETGGPPAASPEGLHSQSDAPDEAASPETEAADVEAPPAPVGFADLLRDPVGPTPDETTGPSDGATGPIATAPQGFVWNLTSRTSEDRDDAEDVAVDDDANPPVRRSNYVEPKPPRDPEAAPIVVPEPPQSAPPQSAPPPSSEPPSSEPPQSAPPPSSEPPSSEPPSFVAALRMPHPPEWGDAPAAPAEPQAPSDSAPAADEPSVDATPQSAEPKGEPEAEQPTKDTGPLRGHGLAALLGGASQQERPAPRPLLGDTTGIIPLPPTYTPPAANPPSDAGTPTSRREALRAEEAATASASAVVPPPLIEPAPPEPIRPPKVAPFSGAAQTEAVLGAPPSPATSPFDAEALAAASAELPTAAIPAEPAPAPTPEPAPAPEPAPEPEAITGPEAAPDQEATDEPDGIAALFGDFALDTAADSDDSVDEDLTRADEPQVHDAAQTPAEPEIAPAVATDNTDTADTTDTAAPGIDAILFPELADDTADASAVAVPEPSAAMEGPQLGSDSAVDFDDFDAIAPPTVAFDAAAAAREPLTSPGPTPAAPASAAASAPPDTTSPAHPTTAPGETPPEPPEPPRGPRDPRFNRRVYLIAGVLAVLLVLVGLFALGTRIPSLFGAAAPSPQASASHTPSATPTPTPTPTPTVIPKPAAAVGPGDHAWDTLGGGECIQPYTSPWAETFTVVDCTTDHTAQMVYTNLISADPAAPYPGADALAQQINTLCTASGVVDLNAAGAYPDLQVQGTFPATEEQWKSGQRSYYCFASRSSGQPLNTSVQGQGPTG